MLADASLVTLLGGAKVYDEAPRAVAAPFVIFGESLSKDVSSNSCRAEEITLTLFVLSLAGGQREAYLVTDKITSILAGSLPDLTGFILVNLTPFTVETRRERNAEATRATLRFRAYLEPVGGI